MKFNLGCGPKKKKGFINVDVRPLPEVDFIWNLTEFPWPWEDNSIEVIVSEETLEHLPWRKQDQIFLEIYRVLEPGGTVFIQVPDIGLMCVYSTNRLICDCVPLHPKEGGDFSPNPECEKCGGRAKINPERWFLAFVGAQKHAFDTHLSIFTREIMEKKLKKAGLTGIVFENTLYKIKVTARKPTK